MVEKTLAEHPQFVTLQFFGEVNEKNVPFQYKDLINNIFQNNDVRDSLGGYVRPTYYVRTDNTDFEFVNRIS